MYTGTDLVIDLNTVAKDERVRDLHHGSLQFQVHHEVYTGTDLVIDLNTVAKDERVRDLHHGSLQVQGQHEAPGLAVSNLLLKELNQVPPIESACYTVYTQ